MTASLGLKRNWKQFTLLIIVNAMIGGMVGLERTLLPEIADQEFHIEANIAILSFIAVFGLSKAISNYFTGVLANKIGRKNLLLIGWVFAIPIPILLIYADNWNTILFANVLLGINQGLAWSSTVIMKIDLVGEKNRGLAMGLNEFAGYFAIAVTAYFTGWIANSYGLRPYPFLIGIFLIIVGFLISIIWVKDTKKHVKVEKAFSEVKRLNNTFWDTTLFNKNLSAVTQAGLINNLNDGMIWGLLPLFLFEKSFTLKEISIIVAVYPAVWGIGQIFTGRMADKFSKKRILMIGMWLQAIAIVMLTQTDNYFIFISLAAILGWGTAMVYPTFLATVAENTHPSDRPKSIGVFRLWRDLGYVLGAILTGIIADIFGIKISIFLTGILTALSGVVILTRMKLTLKNKQHAN